MPPGPATELLSLRRISLVIAATTLLLACRPGGGTTQPAASPAAPATPAPLARTATVGEQAAPSADRVKAVISKSTRTYPVYGRTADELLTYIETYGPVDDRGVRASGTTHYASRLDWRSNGDTRSCSIESMTINVDLQVLLPALGGSALATDVQTNWQAFLDGVAAHEQRHVDIYSRGAEQIKERMLTLAPASGCLNLESQVNSVWDTVQASVDAEQERFHQGEKRRIDGVRGPLKAQIDANRAWLVFLDGQIAAIDANLDTLASQLRALKSVLDSLTAQLQSIEQRYQGQQAPPEVLQQYDSLRNQFNDLVPSYNALVERNASQSAQRADLLRETQTLREQTNALVDQYNWTR